MCVPRIAVVTGANKGLGYEICKQLATKGIMVVLTARDENKGAEAVGKLKESGLCSVVFHRVDVTNPDTIASLADFVRTQFGKLDILVNNAGVGGLVLDFEALGGKALEDVEKSQLVKAIRQTYEMAVECVNINYIGCQRVTEALIPLLQLSTSPRIVMLSSSYGRLELIQSERIKEELRNSDSLTEEKLNVLYQDFLKSFQDNKLEEDGWPTTVSAYKVSKILVGAYTRILARKHPGFCINCVHPGLVNTDINWRTGDLSVEEGAKGPVMLCLLPEGGPSGAFFDQTEESNFEK